MSRKFIALSTLCVTILGLALIVPAFWLDSQQYSALAAGIQAFGVIAALAAAAATLAREARDKRADRVVSMFTEYQGVLLYEARVRLYEHLKGQDGLVHPTSQHDLLVEPAKRAYASGQGSPRQDVEMILRFFESTNGMLTSKVLDVGLAHRLIGRNALWWNFAIVRDETAHLRRYLGELADWARDYSLRHSPDYLTSWDKSFKRDFGVSIDFILNPTSQGDVVREVDATP